MCETYVSLIYGSSSSIVPIVYVMGKYASRKIYKSSCIFSLENECLCEVSGTSVRVYKNKYMFNFFFNQ